MAGRNRQHGKSSENHAGVRKRKTSAGLAALLVLGNSVLFCERSNASPSGLNNIPTADTTDVRTLVWQGWTGFGHAQRTDWWTGFKVGVIEGLELGADYDINAEPSRHVQFQGKYAVNLNDWGTRLAVGLANVSDDRDRNGEFFPYIVLTQDVNKWFRLHGGYDFQLGNGGMFAGIDRSVKLLGRDAMFCADAIQIDRQNDWLLAPGIKFGLGRKAAEGETLSALDKVLQHFVIESWVTFSTQDDAKETYVAKLNFVLPF